MPLTPYSGEWTHRQATHLVRRTLFGARYEDVSRSVSLGLTASVDTLLSPRGAPPEPVAYVRAGAIKEGDRWSSSPYQAVDDSSLFAFLQTWWIGLCLNQEFSLREKLTLFHTNHFAAAYSSVNDARYMLRQNTTIRSGCLGSVKNLAIAMVTDLAMLRYLNGNVNTVSSPNENFARELLELFTIGKGAEAGHGDYTTYTEDDVKQFARIFTGWIDDHVALQPRFRQWDHDSGTKTLSHRFGYKTITGGITESGARLEIEAAIDIIFEQEATARSIVRRLYRWFVDYVITDEIESTIITPLAQTLRDSNYHIEPVLRELFTSQHFYDERLRGCMITTPFDHVLGLIRTFRPTDLFPPDSRHTHWAYRTLRRSMATMGFDVFNPPNVAGLQAYHQSPSYHKIWINSDTLQKRVKFTNDLVSDGYMLDEAYEPSRIDVFTLTSWLSEPRNPVAVVEDVVKQLLVVSLSQEQIMSLVGILSTMDESDTWSKRWDAWLAEPNVESTRSPIEHRLRTLLKAIMSMAEYHVC